MPSTFFIRPIFALFFVKGAARAHENYSTLKIFFEHICTELKEIPDRITDPDNTRK